MPRPLNWIKGEGTTKNQRFGMNGLGDCTPGWDAGCDTSGPLGDTSQINWGTSDAQTYLNQVESTSNTTSMVMVAGLAVLALVLIKKL